MRDRSSPLRRRRAVGALAGLWAAAVWTAGPVAAAQEAQPPKPAPGFLGVELLCSHCSVRHQRGRTVWRFSEPPVVLSVHGGSAAERAGLEPGDALIRIDGVSLTSEEGGRRFGDLREGRPVAFVVRRDGGERPVRVVPGPRPAHLAPDPAAWQERLEVLPPLVRAELDSIFPSLRARLDSLKVRLREHEMRRGLLRERELERSLEEHERWVSVFRDSIRVKLDSLAVHALPTPRARAAPRSPLAYSFWVDDSVAVFAGWNAVAGAQMTVLTEDLREYFPGAERGVLVLRVAAGTPAEQAGLRPGDVIVSARGKTVENVEDLRGVFFESLVRPVELEVVRKGKRVGITIGGE